MARGCAALLAALVTALVTAGAAAHAAATPTQPRWRVPVTIAASGRVVDSYFAATAARNASNIWAVGSLETSTADNTEQSSLVEHFDGRRWRRHSAPPAPAGTRDASLTAVQATPGAPLWVVGDAGFGSADEAGGFVARWNGSRWIEHSFGVDMDVAHLAVIGPTNAWVLLQNQRSGVTKPVAARWNGRQWATMPLVGLPLLLENSDVAASWAPAVDPKTYAPELLHLYGDHWSVVPGPRVRLPEHASGYHYNDIVEERGDVLVSVGYDGLPSPVYGLTLYRRSGTAWQRVANLPRQSPAGMTSDTAKGVWLLSAGGKRATSLLHVGPGGRVLRRVQPPRTANGRMRVDDFSRVPGTASLVAGGYFPTDAGWEAAIGRYRP